MAAIQKQPLVGGERQCQGPSNRAARRCHRTSRTPPPTDIHHHTGDTWKRRKTQRKREKHKNRRDSR